MRSIILRFTLLVLMTVGAVAHAAKFSGVIAFGDSLSDRGNTVAELKTILNETDVYNSNFYDDGRWSNGPLWIEHVNQGLGFTTWKRNDGDPLSDGHDFAWGGSESGTGYTDDLLANLQTQVQYYKDNVKMGPLVDGAIGTKLFSVWSGGNDVINAVQGDTPIDADALSTQMAQNIATAITTLYNAGGRYFIVPNLPDLGKKPNYRTNPFWAGEASEIVNLYNPKLAAEIANLRATLPGITIYAFDACTLLDTVIANPATYGFTNVTTPAYTPNDIPPDYGSVVADPDSHLFWDTTHPTEAGHAIVGAAALALVNPPDTIAPTLVVQRTVRRTSDRKVRISGRASDETALGRVEIRRGSRVIHRARSTRWSAKVPLKVGRNVFRIRSYDTAGNASPVRKIVVRRKR